MFTSSAGEDFHLNGYLAGQSSRRRLLARRNALSRDFERSWKPLLKSVGEYINPWRSRIFFTDANLATVCDKQIDTYPLWALETAANGMMAGMTSPARPWFRLTVRDEGLYALQPVKVYLQEAEDGIRKAFAQSNFYNRLHEVYMDILGSGTGAMHLELDDQDPLRAYVWPVGQFLLANSRRLQVDTIFRDVAMTVSQMVEEFGFEALSPRVQRMVKGQRWDDWVKVVHAIQPNRLYDAKRNPQYDDVDGQPYRSCWFELDVGGDKHDRLLAERGYDRFPVMTPRYDPVGENVYGFSPGIRCLPESKNLQEMWRRLFNIVDLTTDPPMVGPTSVSRRTVAQAKGEWMFVAPGETESVKPLFEIPDGYSREARETILEIRQAIGRHFKLDVWQALIQLDREMGPRQMTAREIDERARQNMLQMGPMLERMQTELFSPAVEWAYDELTEARVLPPPPRELLNVKYEIEYISILAQAQKVATTTALHQLVDFTGVVSQTIDPKAALKLKGPRIIETYADAVGTQPDLLEDDDAFAEKLAAIEAQAEEQRKQQAALAGAKAIRDVSAAANGAGEDALGRMLENNGGAVYGVGGGNAAA